MGTWTNIERAIDLAEEACGLPFDEARNELDAIRKIKKRMNGLRLQHASDSRELRRLCADRDKYKQAAKGWQPIESAPKDGTYIDVWCDGGRIIQARWRCHIPEVHAHDPETYSWWAPELETWGTNMEWVESPLGVTPTHWMAEPEPPQ